MLQSGKSVRRLHLVERRLALATKLGALALATAALAFCAYIIQDSRRQAAEHLRQQAEAARLEEAKLRKQAEADEKKANAAAAKSREVAQFLKEILSSVGPSVARGRDTSLLREILDRTARRVGQDLVDQPDVQIELGHSLADVYHELGLYKRLEETARETLRLGRAHLGEEHPEVAISLAQLGDALMHLGEVNEAEVCTRAALQMQRRLLGHEHLDVARSLNTLGNVVELRHQLAEAEGLQREALAMQRKLLTNDAPDIARTLHYLAGVLLDERKLPKAEQVAREAVTMRKNLFHSDHPDVALSLQRLAVILREQGKVEEAESSYREALGMLRKVWSNDDPRLATSLAEFANLLQKEHKYGEAEALYRQELAIQSLAPEPDPIRRRRNVNNLVRILISERRYDDAEQVFNDALPPSAQTFPENASLFQDRAEFYARRGRWKEAATDAAKALELDPADPHPYHALAVLLVATEDLPAYRRHCQQMVARFEQTTDPVIADWTAKDCLILTSSGVDWKVISELTATAVTLGKEKSALPWFQVELAWAEYRHGQFVSAVGWATKALARPDLGQRDVQAYMVLAMASQQLNQIHEARAALAKGLELEQTKAPRRESGDLGEGWLDWLIAHALTREATTLIEGHPREPQWGPAVPDNHRFAGLAQMIPMRDPAAPANLIDLTAHYNSVLSNTWWTAELPPGVQTLGDVRFDLRGQITVASRRDYLEPNYNVAARFTGIPLRQKFRTLHFLQGAAYRAAEGREIGRYVVHFADGRNVTVPLVYGLTILDFNAGSDPRELLRTPVVWSGRVVKGVLPRLFKFSWENPFPDVEARSLDFESTMSEARPFLIAITAEP